MNDLRPLLECTDDELERALLGSVRADAPSAHGLRDTALALGLTATTAKALAAALPAATTLAAPPLLQAAILPVASSNATTGAIASGASSAATSVGGVTLGAIGKSFIGGALVSFLALTTLDHTVGLSAPPRPSQPSAGATATTTTAAPSPIPADFVGPEPIDTAPAATEAAPTVAGGRAPRRRTTLVPDEPALAPTPGSAPTRATFAPVTPTAAPPPAPASSSLAAEIRLLDQARAALTVNDVTGATRSLDAYAASRPSGVLAQEAAVLRVRLLLAQGQKPAASALARRIIAQNPGSAHADLLRRLAAEP